MKNIVKLSVFVVLFIAGCVSFAPIGITPLVEKTIGGEGGDKVLLIDVSGVLEDGSGKNFLGMETERTLTERMREELDLAAGDRRVRAVVLRINSPGGSVTTSDIISHELKAFKKKKNIPVVAELMDVAASGGYYIAVAADEIIAHPTTVTGSIGVIAFKVDASGLMTKIGIVNETVKSGDKKDFTSPLRHMTGEERRILQSVIDSMYGRFIDVVVDGRGGKVDREGLKSIADGRIFTAQQALEHNLIDSIGYLDDAVEAAKKKAGIKRARVVTYADAGSYRNNIYSSLGSAAVPPQVNLINIDGSSLFAPGPGMRFMYLWTQ